MIRKKGNIFCLLLVIVWAGALASGCSMFKPKLAPPETRPGNGIGDMGSSAPPSPARSYLTHRIQWHGETLSIISKWYTGDYRNWRALVEATPGLEDTRVAVGDEIFIPETLLKNRAPLEKSFVDQHYRSVSSQPGENKTTPGATETGAGSGKNGEEEYKPVPFGPKTYP